MPGDPPEDPRISGKVNEPLEKTEAVKEKKGSDSTIDGIVSEKELDKAISGEGPRGDQGPGEDAE